MTQTSCIEPGESVLLTDLYQLTMAHAYHQVGMRDTAVFELFVRQLPPTRSFLVAAGLAQVIEYLETLEFKTDDLRFLDSLHLFPASFLDYLASVRFTGSVHAMPEGTPFFAEEPILRITAPILEAQLVESRVLNLIHFQSLIASKAIRCVGAARGKQLLDFGMRRAHGAEAALYAARAAYLAGFDATATVEAGRRFGIPLSGTMAHSFIQAHDGEVQAMRNFVTARGGATAVLLDTFDTARAAQRVVTLTRELKAAGAAGSIRGVRIDSGDLATEARDVRRILDTGGCQDIGITLSGGLDEFKIHALLEQNVPVDSFGIGTRLDVSEDAPTLDMVYKLEEYAGHARRKRSIGKATWPGRKQVFRERDAAGLFMGDLIGLESDMHVGQPLLDEVMRDGLRLRSLPSLADSRAHCRQQIARLPFPVTALSPDAGRSYPVAVSDTIRALAQRIDSVNP